MKLKELFKTSEWANFYFSGNYSVKEGMCFKGGGIKP